MDVNIYAIDELPDEKFSHLIESRKSFTLTNITHMKKTVLKIESLIEAKGLKCRVHTKGRAATVAAAAIPVSPAVLGGWLSGIAIGVHNLATYDPDYEIGKNRLSKELDVKYKK